MQTDCQRDQFVFQEFEKRAVVAGFDSGATTSNAGVLLLREGDSAINLTRRVVKCFTDHLSGELNGFARKTREPAKYDSRVRLVMTASGVGAIEIRVSLAQSIFRWRMKRLN